VKWASREIDPNQPTRTKGRFVEGFD